MILHGTALVEAILWVNGLIHLALDWHHLRFTSAGEQK